MNVKSDKGTGSKSKNTNTNANTIEGFDNYTPDEDGVYRWVYEFELLKNPSVLLEVWKILLYVNALIFAFDFLISIGNVGFWWGGFAQMLKLFLLLCVLFVVLGFAGYMIYAAIMKGKYCVMFEMDDEGIRHTQITSQFMKAKGISAAAIVTGVAVHNPALVGSGLLSGMRNSLYTEWRLVKKLRFYPRFGLIKLSAPLNRNQVYIARDDYEFVRKYVEDHCLNVKGGR